MIAHDTGYAFVPEEDFGCGKLPELAAILQSGFGPMVIQCPFLTDIIHDLGYYLCVEMDKALVVMMRRDIDDIKASEARTIAADGKNIDFDYVGRRQRRVYHLEESQQHIAEIRYRSWQDQKKVIPNALDVEYESLSEHPLWDSRHKCFSLRQTAFDVVPDDSSVVFPKKIPVCL